MSLETVSGENGNAMISRTLRSLRNGCLGECVTYINIYIYMCELLLINVERYDGVLVCILLTRYVLMLECFLFLFFFFS